jgi:hypothetical protein
MVSYLHAIKSLSLENASEKKQVKLIELIQTHLYYSHIFTNEDISLLEKLHQLMHCLKKGQETRQYKRHRNVEICLSCFTMTRLGAKIPIILCHLCHQSFELTYHLLQGT